VSALRSLGKVAVKTRLLSFYITLMFFLSDTVYAADVTGETATDTPMSTSGVLDPLSGEHLFKLTGALLFVVVAVFISAWFLRKMTKLQGGESQALKILAGLSMGQRERIVLVQVGNEQLLLGVSPGRIQSLLKLETPIDISDSASVSSAVVREKFSSLLNKTLLKMKASKPKSDHA